MLFGLLAFLVLLVFLLALPLRFLVLLICQIRIVFIKHQSKMTSLGKFKQSLL